MSGKPIKIGDILLYLLYMSLVLIPFLCIGFVTGCNDGMASVNYVIGPSFIPFEGLINAFFEAGIPEGIEGATMVFKYFLGLCLIVVPIITFIAPKINVPIPVNGSSVSKATPKKRSGTPPVRYLVKTYSQQYGPYSLKELRHQHSRGNFDADALVSVEGSKDWYDLNAKIDKL